MAARGDHHNQNQIQKQPKKLSLFPLLSLLIFVSIFLFLSLSRKTYFSSSSSRLSTFQPTNRSEPIHSLTGSCDYSNGKWVYDPNLRSNERYDGSCKEIFKGWNCLLNNKSNAAEITKWKWKPNGCDLQPLDPVKFLEAYRDTNIGTFFVSL